MSNQQKPESNACDQCFRRKQSCSKSQPECQRCHDTGSSCTYSFGKFMGKPKKSLKTRRQLQQKSIEPAIHHGLKVKTQDDHSQAQRHRNVPLPSSNSQTQARQHEKLNSPSIQTDSGLWPWPTLTAHTDDTHPPTRFEPEKLQASTRKRGNSTPACDQCYRFKVKCTKEPGRCQRCVNSGSVCTYSSTIELDSPQKRRRVMSYSENRTPTNENIIPPVSGVSQKSVEDLLDFNTPIPLPTPPNSAHPALTSVPTDPSVSILGSPTIMIDPSLYLEADYSSWTTPHDQLNNWQEFPFPENEHHHFATGTTEDPNHEAQTSKSNTTSSPCDCLSSALSVLAKLQECLNFGDHSSFDNMLSAARSGFRVCEQSSRCNHCSRSIMLMLCIVILQQVGKCYDNLAVNKAATMPTMSLKLGSMEFHGFSSPNIMSTILGIEKKQGAAVCLGLDKLTRPAGDCRDEAVWGGDHLSGLLGVFRERFTATV